MWKDQSIKKEQLEDDMSEPVTAPLVPETMQAYFKRLKKDVQASWFKIVDEIDTDGLYIGKRAIRGAQGQGDLLNQAGSVFYHTVLYVRHAGQTSALDYGPQGNADVTANIMEAVPCGPILHENAEPDAGYPLLRVEQPYSDPDSELCRKDRKYHAINNNCIHNTDFLCRILTHGRVRNAPMIYDLLAGKIPERDHPMLLMFFLMTQLSWFHVCDGSPLTKAFLEHEGLQSNLLQGKASDNRKPDAQSRLEENQLDLLQLVQSLQPDVHPTDSQLQPKPN